MSSEEIRRKFLDFFKARGHAFEPSSSLIPDDPSVLLTTAGVQQFKRYYTGELDAIKYFKDVQGNPTRNVVSIQKCFRTSDIDEVGDESHLTFFEMLGNFSFGGYFKEDAIKYAYEFITKEMGLEISYVTVFKGLETSSVIPKDEESKEIWKSLGVTDTREQGMEDVFWGPTGSEGPCGPTTEVYIKNSAGEDIEVWNIVFNEFYCYGSREQLLNAPNTIKLKDLPFKGIDTGMGLERLAMVAQGKKNIFETDLFVPVIKFLQDEFSEDRPEWSRRIVADHARSIMFLIADGVLPSNKNQGYILRRLIRRSIPHLHEFDFFDAVRPMGRIRDDHFLDGIVLVVDKVIKEYSRVAQYQYLVEKREFILQTVREENDRFIHISNEGGKLLEKIINLAIENKKGKIFGEDIFNLITTHGFSIDWIKDKAKIYSLGLDLDGFERLFRKHQEISRAGLEKKFGGHGLILDTGELKAGDEAELKKVTRLHTATHLLQQALRDILGSEIKQAGSDITAERTRFDFNFSRKLTAEEIKKVEERVNEIIKKDLPVWFQEMPKEEAMQTGALFYFREKYPEQVKVYYVGSSLLEAYSKEFCGGPHVTHTAEIGQFKILKEEAISSGVRRIRATVE